MGTSREARESEKIFDRIFSEIRSLDKCLWYGNPYMRDDIIEYIDSIKGNLNNIMEAFDDEVGETMEEQRKRKANIYDLRIPSQAVGLERSLFELVKQIGEQLKKIESRLDELENNEIVRQHKEEEQNEIKKT